MEFKRALSVIKNQSLKRHRDLLSISILAFLTVIFLWRIVFLGQIMLPVDMIYQVEPWKSESIEKPSGPPWNPNLTDSIWGLYPILSYAKDARQLGEGFFWDPYSVGGMPAMARGDMFLNPILIILSAFLPIYQTLNWMAVIHLFLAGVFTYLLLMEMGVSPYGALIGGLVFAFNGYLIGWLALANFHNTAIWLPLILWGIRARHQAPGLALDSRWSPWLCSPNRIWLHPLAFLRRDYTDPFRDNS